MTKLASSYLEKYNVRKRREELEYHVDLVLWDESHDAAAVHVEGDEVDLLAALDGAAAAAAAPGLGVGVARGSERKIKENPSQRIRFASCCFVVCLSLVFH